MGGYPDLYNHLLGYEDAADVLVHIRLRVLRSQRAGTELGANSIHQKRGLAVRQGSRAAGFVLARLARGSAALDLAWVACVLPDPFRSHVGSPVPPHLTRHFTRRRDDAQFTYQASPARRE